MAQLWVIQEFWYQIWKAGPIAWASCKAVTVDASNCTVLRAELGGSAGAEAEDLRV